MNPRASHRCRLRLTIVALLVQLAHAQAQEPSIDNLLKKLPPPEKLVNTPIQRALNVEDPALKDPLGNEVVAALRKQDFHRANGLIEKLAQRYPQSAAVSSIEAAIKVRLRDYPGAEKAAQHALAIDPKYALAHFLLGNLEAEQGRFSRALPHFQKAADLESKTPVAWIYLSACEEKVGHKRAALDAARRATTVAPAFLPAWLSLVRAEKASGHTLECLHALTRAADLSPDNASMLAAVGYAYINLNRIPEAVGPLQRAARFSPNDFLVQAQLGFCLTMTGQIEAGIEHLRKSAKLNPNYAPAWEHLGLTYEKQGRHRDAVTAFERAVKIVPMYKLAWEHLALEYRLVGHTAASQQAAYMAAHITNAPPSAAKAKPQRRAHDFYPSRLPPGRGG
ncbi:MAG TPA: tetratricopeptide repeat protein [Chthoniobacterales bacterium]|nr:tetratricopeptide repeat protein [Chthoniobacterales bacterium]